LPLELPRTNLPLSKIWFLDTKNLTKPPLHKKYKTHPSENLKQNYNRKTIMIPTTTKPIATTSSIVETPSFGNNVAGSRTRSAWSHSPVVTAMITNNRLTNCRDVTAMVQECSLSSSNDQVCRTASQYLDVCMQ
jgi:hypothetical protein